MIQFVDKIIQIIDLSTSMTIQMMEQYKKQSNSYKNILNLNKK